MSLSLDSGDLRVRVDQTDPAQWDLLLDLFKDASIYQSRPYGEVRWGKAQLSRMVLEHQDQPVAIAQLRIVKVPMVKAGIAYLRWGPIWQRKDRPADPAVLKTMLAAMQREYCDNRGLLLRILPNLPEAFCEEYRPIFSELG
ncbi:MAG TPA: hypothetical protein PKV71_16075, partial [Calditrichia bacterium]|nr:hypothetical protein [Calditrichia bacterium]